MTTVPFYVRYSETNLVLDKVADLYQEGNLVFNPGGPCDTAFKFALLTAASPLISVARLIRSAVFLLSGNANRAGREFVGALFAQVLALGCFGGSLISAFVHVISSGQKSFHGTLRRTYAYFEAWVNRLDWKSQNLPSYKNRVTDALDWANPQNNRIWTTAPCMQPLLENGERGLLSPERIQKIFPLIKVNDVVLEDGQYVIQSEYEDVNTHYVACNGAFEHHKIESDFCCCYRIEAVYDRFLCCELGKGTCRSVSNHGDSCSIVSCGACGVGACCCYAKEDHQIVELNAGCFGPAGLSYGTVLRRTV